MYTLGDIREELRKPDRLARLLPFAGDDAQLRRALAPLTIAMFQNKDGSVVVPAAEPCLRSCVWRRR